MQRPIPSGSGWDTFGLIKLQLNFPLFVIDIVEFFSMLVCCHLWLITPAPRASISTSTGAVFDSWIHSSNNRYANKTVFCKTQKTIWDHVYWQISCIEQSWSEIVGNMHLAPSRAEVENGKTCRWMGSPSHGGLARSLQQLGHLFKQGAECWHAILVALSCSFLVHGTKLLSL